MPYELFQTDTPLVTSLPVTGVDANGNIKPYVRNTVYSIEIKAKKNDLLIAMGQFEVTNDLGFNVMISCSIVRSTKADDKIVHVISHGAGDNATKDTHHKAAYPHGMEKIRADFEGHVNLVLWAASTAARDGQTVKVEHPGYGGLSVALVR